MMQGSACQNSQSDRNNSTRQRSRRPNAWYTTPRDTTVRCWEGARITENRVVIVGAGAGGLSAAITLSACGVPVTVIEKAAEPGGKMRQVPFGAGIDAGPTVFTMRWVFEELFGRAGWDLESAVSLQQTTCLARHAWSDGAGQDGGRFDLWADPEQAADAVVVLGCEE